MADLRATAATAMRFGVAGLANTLVTAVLLSILARIIDPSVAYALVFAAGIALSTVLARSYVFRTRLSARQVILYIALYIVVFVLGLVVLKALIRWGMPHGASGLVVLVTAPLTFIGARLIVAMPDPSARARRADQRADDSEKGPA